MGPGGDPEAYSHGNAPALGRLAHTSYNIFDLRVHRRASPGDTEDAHYVDEGVCQFCCLLHPLRSAGGCHDRHKAEVVLHTLGVEIIGLLAGQIDDDEAVDTLSLCVLASPVGTVLQKVVVVAHQHHRHLEALAPGLLYIRKAVGQGGVVCQGLPGCLLDRSPIRHGVGKRHAQLDHICAALLEPQQNVHSTLLARVTGCGERDKGRAVCCLASFESLNDARGRHPYWDQLAATRGRSDV
mmetsp:Transcript_24080/g.51146  ORF Transcript_24080/g.51146 Transcript_24080/m.51146 type:complete len:240 (+) Transcript_24080:1592-2311(+)